MISVDVPFSLRTSSKPDVAGVWAKMSDDILLKSKAAVGKATKTGGEGMSKGLPIMERGTRAKRGNIITLDQCHKQENRRVDELILCSLFFLNRELAEICGADTIFLSG